MLVAYLSGNDVLLLTTDVDTDKYHDHEAEKSDNSVHHTVEFSLANLRQKYFFT